MPAQVLAVIDGRVVDSMDVTGKERLSPDVLQTSDIVYLVDILGMRVIVGMGKMASYDRTASPATRLHFYKEVPSGS